MCWFCSQLFFFFLFPGKLGSLPKARTRAVLRTGGSVSKGKRGANRRATGGSQQEYAQIVIHFESSPTKPKQRSSAGSSRADENVFRSEESEAIEMIRGGLRAAFQTATTGTAAAAAGVGKTSQKKERKGGNKRKISIPSALPPSVHISVPVDSGQAAPAQPTPPVLDLAGAVDTSVSIRPHAPPDDQNTIKSLEAQKASPAGILGASVAHPDSGSGGGDGHAGTAGAHRGESIADSSGHDAYAEAFFEAYDASGTPADAPATRRPNQPTAATTVPATPAGAVPASDAADSPPSPSSSSSPPPPQLLSLPAVSISVLPHQQPAPTALADGVSGVAKTPLVRPEAVRATRPRSSRPLLRSSITDADDVIDVITEERETPEGLADTPSSTAAAASAAYAAYANIEQSEHRWRGQQEHPPSFRPRRVQSAGLLPRTPLNTPSNIPSTANWTDTSLLPPGTASPQRAQSARVRSPRRAQLAPGSPVLIASAGRSAGGERLYTGAGDAGTGTDSNQAPHILPRTPQRAQSARVRSISLAPGSPVFPRPSSSPPRTGPRQQRQRAQSARPHGSSRQQQQQGSAVDKVYRAASARSRRNVRAVHAAGGSPSRPFDALPPSPSPSPRRQRPHTAAPLGQHERAQLMQGAALSPPRRRRVMSAAPALRRSRAASAHHLERSGNSGRASPTSATSSGIFDENGRNHNSVAPTPAETLAAATVGTAVGMAQPTEPAQPPDFVQSQHGRFDLAPMKLNARPAGKACHLHNVYHDDCPRCLQRLLTPRTTETVRIGGGFKILEQGDEAGFNGHGAWRGRVPDADDAWSLKAREPTRIFDERRQKAEEEARRKQKRAEEGEAAGVTAAEFVRNSDSMKQLDDDGNVMTSATRAMEARTAGAGAELRSTRGSSSVKEAEEEAAARKRRAKKKASELAENVALAAVALEEGAAAVAAEEAAAAAAEEEEVWNGEGIKPRTAAEKMAAEEAAAAEQENSFFNAAEKVRKKKKKEKKEKAAGKAATPPPPEPEPEPEPEQEDDAADDDATRTKRKPERRKLMKMPSSKGRRRPEVPSIKFTEKKYPVPLDYLSRFCVLPDDKLHVFRQVFDAIDLDKDETVTMEELNFGVRSVNQSMITSKEAEYVNTVLEVRLAPEIDFQCFAVICALSEKVVALDRFVKHKINKMNPEAMELKINGCKDMYYMLDEQQDGFVEFEMLMREVRAGQITQEHEDIIIDKFMENGKSHVDFLDFLTYIPLFMEIHDTINLSPLDLDRVN